MVLDGFWSGPQHHTFPSMLAERNRRGKTRCKSVWRVHQSKALIFSLKSFEHISSRSKELLGDWVHLGLKS